MIKLLKGQIVYVKDSVANCEIIEHLENSAEYEIYSVKLKNDEFILNRYYPTAENDERLKKIEILIKKGSPGDNFLWPVNIIFDHSGEKLGYLTPKPEKRYISIYDILNRKTSAMPGTLVLIGIKIANCISTFHSNGYFGGDLSLNNFYCDPKNGEILMCGVDNIFQEEDPADIIPGNPRFMAPEIIRGEGLPCKNTDLHSLAVMLFYLLIQNHPLHGKIEKDIKSMDQANIIKIYGESPLFIYDPKDDSNRPVTGHNDNAITFWKTYPEFIKNLFIKAFTIGLKNPVKGRPNANEWGTSLLKLLDLSIYCKCGAINYYDEKLYKNYTEPKCYSCSNSLKLPLHIKIGRNIIMLGNNTKIYPYHLDSNTTPDISSPIAEVSINKNNSDLLGLKNLTGQKWTLTSNGENTLDVEPGRSATIKAGIKINFGTIEGTITI